MGIVVAGAREGGVDKTALVVGETRKQASFRPVLETSKMKMSTASAWLVARSQGETGDGGREQKKRVGDC